MHLLRFHSEAVCQHMLLSFPALHPSFLGLRFDFFYGCMLLKYSGSAREKYTVMHTHSSKQVEACDQAR